MSHLKDAIDLNDVKKVLIIKLRHHGDVLLTSPLFQVLKNHHPHLEIDALVYADTQEMLSLHPAINQIITINRNWKKQGLKKQISHEYGLLKQLKSQKYDLIIHLTEHWRGTIISRLCKPKFAVTAFYPRRGGRFWHNSFSHHYPIPQKPRHTVEKHLDALRRIGVYPSQSEKDLILINGEDAENSANALLLENNLKENDYILIHPTSRWLFKCWEIDKFAQLIDYLHENNHQVIITAAPSDHELQIIKGMLKITKSSPIDLSGKLSLKELSVLIAKAKCFVGVDSVPMHIAAAHKTPCIALFGPSGDLEWGPWTENFFNTEKNTADCTIKSRVLTSHHSCRPCGIDGCGGGKKSDCLTAITLSQVTKSISEIL